MTAPALAEDQILTALSQGTYDIAGQFVYGSNYTFLVEVAWQEHRLEAVYKPSQGERPLWDFPEGTLAHRETAAYEVCQAMGWSYVPPTILRPDGPAGPGSLQLYVNLDPERHYFSMTEPEKKRLKSVALFDALINNADRKGGHVLLGPEDRIWLIDHGLCFHQEYKLRTVIWDFAGQPIPASLLEKTEALLDKLEAGELVERLSEMLSTPELEALADRARQILEEATFPTPGERRHYPWPLV